MATRPERIILEEGQQAWDAEVDTNFEQLTDAPTPFHSEPTVGDLTSKWPAADYVDCVCIVARTLYISNGTSWEIYRQAALVADSTAATAADMATDFNLLLSALQTAGIMATS